MKGGTSEGSEKRESCFPDFFLADVREAYSSYSSGLVAICPSSVTSAAVRPSASSVCSS
eukprot:CAMPEP_0182468892 /NCGR_PEP_ID=MMETSP1319-20130603/16207_2 /TAXON_ID=172717 /ORGANISM="Bolidomonas pacifica, Strain RCC208" /LENGTH=58 /DNA_ID=CAMNT_0024669141 /DNA_START=67 /DNA_END=240 /DNA_ORIENTATION=-